MQRAPLSLLRSFASGTAQLEGTLQRALVSSYFTAGSAGTSSAGPTLAGRRGVLSGLSSSDACSAQSVRFAGDYKPEVPGNTIDNWAAMRSSLNKERPNSLGANYYLNILVMGFAYLLNEAYFFPPRTVYMGAMVFFLLYVRKAHFTTPLAFKQQY